MRNILKLLSILLLLNPVFLPFYCRGVSNESTPIAKIFNDRNDFFASHEDEHDHDHYGVDVAGTLDALLDRLSSTGYDTRLRPHLKGFPVLISCSVHIGTITSISESNMDYTMDFYFRQSWDDYRLKWNSSDNEPVNIAGDNIDFIWKPDSFFPNAKFGSFNDVTRHNGFARLLPRGHVRMSTRVKITAYCPMDLRYYPLDRQKCSLYIESFALPIKDLIYYWGDGYQEKDVNHALGFADDVSSLTQFDISGFRIYETYLDRHDGYNHSRLVIDFYFQRNLGYYMIQVYLPAALMVISSWIAFWLPRNSSPARVTLGVTTVLTVVTLSGQEHTSLPKISYLKAMDIYLLFCFASVFFSLLEFAVVSYAFRHLRRRNIAWFCQHSYETPKDDDGVDKFTTPLVHLRDSATSPPSRYKKRISKANSWETWKDAHGLWYLSIPSAVERGSRIIFPLFFICFNAVYWYYFFFLHHNNTEDEPGYIPLKTEPLKNEP